MILEHKGYIASISLEDGDELMHGEVLNTRATLHFAGKNPKELRKAFVDTVADYLDMCKERGISPEKPYSGEFRLRLPPELHKALAIAALRRSKSLNTFIEEQLSEAVAIDALAAIGDVVASTETKKRRRAAHA